MHGTLKPYATAGVVIAGASLIAATPALATLPAGPIARDVALTAGGATLADIVEPYIGSYNEASQSLSTLLNSFFLAPGVGMQQALANMSEDVQKVLDDPASLGEVTRDIQQNIKDVVSAFSLVNADADTLAKVIPFTMDGSATAGHAAIFSQIGGFLPPDQADTLTPIINFLASPLSGIMIGAVGPLIAPGVALGNTLGEFGEQLQGGDFAAALQTLAGAPANMFDASLNGATVDLDALLPLINGAGLLPAGKSIDHLEFAFGGLFSTGEVKAGDLQVPGTDDTVPAVGGSIFNSIGIDLSTGVSLSPTIHAEAHPIGLLGALLGADQLTGQMLGSNWWSWGGKGAAPGGEAIPPGEGIHLPTIPDDFFRADFLSDAFDSDTAGGAGADAFSLADVSGLADGLADLLGA